METNLEAVKDMSKLLFEAVPIEEVQQLKGLGIVQHPFVNSTHTINPQTGKMIDLRVSDQLQEYKEGFFKFLCAGDIYRILGMVNSGWKMTWFKHCCPFLSPKDYGELLAPMEASFPSPQDLKKGDRHLDDDEFLDVHTVPLKVLVEDVMAGKITDAKTQVCILKAARLLGV